MLDRANIGSDPTRNPAPLPLPDSHVPISGIRTQSKVSAAHRKLGSAASSRSLSQIAQEHEQTPPGIYELVSMIHTNLEILMKRSQNNARDLGKLRGDVKNPHAIEEIKKILQESSSMHASGDAHDPEKQRLIDSEMATKLDALLKMSQTPQEKPIIAPPTISTDHLASAEAVSTMSNHLAEGLRKIQTTLGEHLPVPTPEPVLDTQIISVLDKIQSTLDAHLPVVIPEPAPIVPVPQFTPERVKVNIDTSALESIVADLSAQIKDKTETLQKLDATLLVRHTELANLETRSVALQTSLTGLIAKVAEVRQEESRRQQELQEQRASRDDAIVRKKKSVVSRKVLIPLAPSADRRIVSLSNVLSSPSRKATPQNVASSPAPLAAPLERESPFVQLPFVLPSSVNPSGGEIKLSPHRMQTTMRTPPDRKSSWSRRVSQIFSNGNKENGPMLVDSGFSKSHGYFDQSAAGSIGRGFAGRDSVRSFRSFSHRV